MSFKFLNNKKTHRILVPFSSTQMMIEVDTDMGYEQFVNYMNENVICERWSNDPAFGIFTLRRVIRLRLMFHFGNVRTYGLMIDGVLTRMFRDDERVD